MVESVGRKYLQLRGLPYEDESVLNRGLISKLEKQIGAEEDL